MATMRFSSVFDKILKYFSEKYNPLKIRMFILILGLFHGVFQLKIEADRDADGANNGNPRHLKGLFQEQVLAAEGQKLRNDI